MTTSDETAPPARPHGQPPVDLVLVVMPFADINRPALGVSLLKSAARLAGYRVEIEYMNLRFAELIGGELYSSIANNYPPDLLLGEWMFADDLFGEEIPAEEAFCDQILRRVADEQRIADLIAARRRVAEYLDECAAVIGRHGSPVVGFTTTFHQTCASVAVARRIATRGTPPTIVFGGANCEGTMGEQLLRSFDVIDYVCAGESEHTIVALMDHVLRRGPGDVPGVLQRGGTPRTPSVTVSDIDALPIPDFDDYFRQIGAVSGPLEPQLTIETSRGCWWGERRHCTFCGLNGETMAFRSKSPERAFHEIVDLCERHGTTKVSCVDNILDPSYVDSLFPRLAECDLDFEIFYEVKANLHRDQLERMRAGGVRSIQPGIESLSDQVLRLMRKGTTAFQNIQLLRWCAELDIDVAWNVLAGFPDESASEYSSTAELMPTLVHLQPPVSCSPVRLDRFSPFHTDPDEYGFRRVRPARAYFYVYPFGRRQLDRLAYFFEFDYGDGRDVDSYLGTVHAAVGDWWRAWTQDRRPMLDARVEGESIRIVDTRPCARAADHVVTGLRAHVLTRCDQTTTVTALARSDELGRDRPALEEAIDSLVEDGLIARRGGQLVALVVFRSRSTAFQFGADHDVHDVAATPVPAPLLGVGRSAGRVG